MMPNSWFYKLRDMRRQRGHPPATGGGGVASAAMLPSSSPPPPQRGARRSATRPASPRRGSVALPHRTSYYYPTRDRELPAPEPKDAATEEDRQHRQLLPQHQQQSPPRCSRRRHRVGAVRVGRGLEAPTGARRRRDMYVGRDGSDDEDDDVDEVRRPAVIAASDYSVSGKVIASETDIVIDLCSESTAERVLRPIVTRPAMREVVRYELKETHVVDVADTTTPAGGSSASEQGSNKSHPRRPSVSVGRRLRTRVNSPRLASTTTRSSRKSISKPTTPGASPRRKTTTPAPPAPLAESFAVVKSSANPRRDFRESMEEMIAEKGIRDAADLEDLLACYLALNAAEHHDLIVEVFEEIWSSLAVAGANP